MGCTPSKGKLFSKEQQSGLQNEPEDSQKPADSESAEDDKSCFKTDGKENEAPKEEENNEREDLCSEVLLDTKEEKPTQDEDETDVHASPQAVEDLPPTGKKSNKTKDLTMEKLRKNSVNQARFEFPPHMVRAHQAAYAFLTPNISKYDLLLGLLDQAAQTQLSLKPMMSALALRFEEINQALEEMAEEGEMMLKEHGDYLTSALINPCGMPPPHIASHPSEPPLDLLQQLLQHSTEKMKLVGGSVQALGDSTLEEAVECSSSLSKLLVEKLQVKQGMEKRLSQVLVQVERATIRKFSPEDAALHSEDSGIGGENESLTGSERRHRGSAGSGGSGSGMNLCSALVGQDEDEADDYGDKEDMQGRKRSNSCPPDPTQTLLFMCADNTKPEPLGRVNMVAEVERRENCDQQMTKTATVEAKKELVGTRHTFLSGMRRHSTSGLESFQKESWKSAKSADSLPIKMPQPPKRNSVRKLINTFSQGVEGRPGRSLVHAAPLVRRPKKHGLLVLSDGANTDDQAIMRWSEGKDDLDLETLPPPPPEVLMDNSFQSNQNGPQVVSDLHFPPINQNPGVPHRLRACVQNLDVLPNRSSLRPRFRTQDVVQQPDTNLGSDMVKRAEQRRGCKGTHLDLAEQTPDKGNTAGNYVKGALHQSRIGKRFESVLYEGETSTSSLPWTAPPVSRVRLQPPCQSVHRSHPILTPVNRPVSPTTFTSTNSEDVGPSVSFHTARSVFCQSDAEQLSPGPPLEVQCFPGYGRRPPKAHFLGESRPATGSLNSQVKPSSSKR
ncbi:photoreceptor cilium actin regulator [Dunckerocampus dactyliophorus]|uniref:photoreceptor cilium actin regulator n=1 Tax=Dunckerocampus dactyliophorus TaxID=161453 RepID=UPI002404A945|nr:photoreceptor cilium actin regulator [Dunckerocampus dactyliophorus]